MSKKDAYHHGDLKAALITGAIELIAKENVDSLSLRRLARYVGVSHAAPYRHFADKDELLAAIAEEGFRLLTRALNHAQAASEQNLLQQLHAIGNRYIQWGLQHSAHYRVMFGATQHNFGQFDSLREAARSAFAVLLQVIQQGQAQGLMIQGDARLIADTAWAIVHGFVMLMIDGQLSTAEAEERTAVGLQTFINGLSTV
jgi:AcrR family transcriptional regulator